MGLGKLSAMMALTSSLKRTGELSTSHVKIWDMMVWKQVTGMCSTKCCNQRATYELLQRDITTCSSVAAVDKMCIPIMYYCPRWWNSEFSGIQQQLANPVQHQLPWVCLQLLWLLVFHYSSLGMPQPPNGCCGNVLWWWVSMIWCLNVCQVLILVFTIPPISS